MSSQSSSNVGSNGVFHRECLSNIVKSKWTDVALIASTIVFLLIGILASSGIFNSIGSSQAAYLSYGMYGGAAVLFVAEIIKRVTLCMSTDVTANSSRTNDPAIKSSNSLVNTNDNLGVSQLLAEAERQFAFHPLKKDILAQIRAVLPQVVERNGFAYGRAREYDTDEEMEKQHAIEDALESFFCRKDLFKNLKISKYGGSILGQVKMKNQILEKAEEFIKSIASQKNQKDVLNYIRQVVYDRNFLSNPVAFINKWIKDREGKEYSNMYLFPSIAEIYLGNEHQATQETKLPNEVMDIIAQKYANFASDTALYFFKQLM
jgi:hypothetical protein